MISKGRYITQLGDGDRVKAVFMVSQRRLLTARSGKPYAKLLLTDRTGEIQGIIWDDAAGQIADIEPGSIAGVRASVETFNNSLQMRIEKITRLEEENIDMSALIPTTKGDMPSMMKELEDIMSTLKDRHLRTLVGNILANPGFREDFMKAPAAKGVHHNYVGGLLEHTLGMLKSIQAIFPVYAHLNINRDLVLTGAFLHDVGKIQEYSGSRFIEMTPTGRLIGHIYISAQLVDTEASRIEDFPEELKLQLVHIILSHHGQMEFGSPKPPMTKEALFLHMIDDFDAKLIGFSAIIDATPDEEDFSSFSKIYDRYLYTKVYEDTPGEQ